jgi:acyl-ACP thioesterase
VSAALPAADLVPVPAGGRRYVGHRPVRLGDVDPDGSLRFDALARYLQDVAADDAADAGLDPATGWLVRRSLVVVEQPARLGERVELTTFCSGTGRSWAERRTSLRGDGGAAVEASSLWVQVSVASGRPATLDQHFHELYGTAAGGRRVSARLTLPGPPPAAVSRPWAVRRVDLDTFGHVNNAAHWALVEEALVPGGGRRGRAEVEFHGPVDGGDELVLRTAAGEHGSVAAWLVADDVRVSVRWTPGAPSAG